MLKRTLGAALIAVILLTGCDTTGAAPTAQPGFTNPPATAPANQPAPGTNPNVTYPTQPAQVVPTTDPNAPYPPPQPTAVPNPAYPTPTP